VSFAGTKGPSAAPRFAWVALAAVAMLSGGCATEDKPRPARLSDMVGKPLYWIGTVTPAVPVDVSDPTRYTLLLGPQGQLSIRADCNKGRSKYEITEGRIAFGTIALTRVACPAGSQDAAFLRQLDAARTGTVEGPLLSFVLYGSEGTMIFAREPQARVAVYACANAKRFWAVYLYQRAHLDYEGRSHTLLQTQSGSGARYAGGAVSLFTRGNEALLEIGGTRVAESCNAVPASR